MVYLKFIPQITFLDSSIIFFVFFSCKAHRFGIQPPATPDEHLFLFERRMPQSVLWISFRLSSLPLLIIYSFSSICNQILTFGVFSFLQTCPQISSSKNQQQQQQQQQRQQNFLNPTPPVTSRVSLPLEPMFSKHLPVFTVFVIYIYISCKPTTSGFGFNDQTVPTIKLNHSQRVTKSNPHFTLTCCSLTSLLSSL